MTKIQLDNNMRNHWNKVFNLCLYRL